MFQKYYDTNIMTTFVKNLVGSTYIPNIPIWKPDTKIIKNNIYITPNYIVRALKSYPDEITPYQYENGPRTDLDGNYFDIIDKYVDNTSNHGYCTKYNSPNSYYDPTTHYYLGQYLRMQRDMHNLNLMAYYNCWCGEYSDKLRINGSEITKDNTTSDGLKTLLVPIKYNQEYTIYINTNYPVSIASVCIANKTVLGNVLTPTNISATNFFKPYLFKGVNKTETDNNSNELEKYLTLLIQVSVQSASNIIVLEGDYTKNNLISYGTFGINDFNVKNKLLKVFYNKPQESGDINYFEYSQLIDDYCKISPELIRNISDVNYAFDNRLVEYLLLNTITNNDDISENITRVQTYLLSNHNATNNKIIIDENEEHKIKDFALSNNNNYNHIKGVWDNQLRMYIYDLITQHWKTPKTTDISGYVDKDVETIIGDIV